MPLINNKATAIEIKNAGRLKIPELRGQFDVKHDRLKEGQFTSPHGCAWDHDGNLYVEDWNVLGRVTKLKRVKPAK